MDFIKKRRNCFDREERKNEMKREREWSNTQIDEAIEREKEANHA